MMDLEPMGAALTAWSAVLARAGAEMPGLTAPALAGLYCLGGLVCVGLLRNGTRR